MASFKPTVRLGWRKWRIPQYVLITLLLIEFGFTVAALALFSIADPDTYRTKLWQDGFDNGFNSSPDTPIFAMVNGRPVKVPIVWSSTLTKFNVVISILSMFILLCKSVMVPMHILFPGISFWLHGLEVGLYAYSVYGQTAPDTIDPERENHGPPWYITKSCNVSRLPQNIGYCKQAKGTFYVTVFLLVIFASHMLLSIHSMLFSPAPRDDDDEWVLDSKAKNQNGKEQEWEMVRIPDTPGTFGGLKSPGIPMSPTTPRTRAFNTLQGGGGSGGAGGKDLPLRQYFDPPPTKPVREKGRLF